MQAFKLVQLTLSSYMGLNSCSYSVLRCYSTRDTSVYRNSAIRPSPIRMAQIGPFSGVSHTPTLEDSMSSLSYRTSLPIRNKCSELTLLVTSVFQAPGQVPCFCRAMQDMSELPSHTSMKQRELTLITIYNAPTRDDG
jgi:hypothetical protein